MQKYGSLLKGVQKEPLSSQPNLQLTTKSGSVSHSSSSAVRSFFLGMTGFPPGLAATVGFTPAVAFHIVTFGNKFVESCLFRAPTRYFSLLSLLLGQK